MQFEVQKTLRHAGAHAHSLYFDCSHGMLPLQCGRMCCTGFAGMPSSQSAARLLHPRPVGSGNGWVHRAWNAIHDVLGHHDTISVSRRTLKRDAKNIYSVLVCLAVCAACLLCSPCTSSLGQHHEVALYQCPAHSCLGIVWLGAELLASTDVGTLKSCQDEAEQLSHSDSWGAVVIDGSWCALWHAT
jgi:hypothetical protein